MPGIIHITAVRFPKQNGTMYNALLKYSSHPALKCGSSYWQMEESESLFCSVTKVSFHGEQYEIIFFVTITERIMCITKFYYFPYYSTKLICTPMVLTMCCP